ncbi:MAG: zinc metallopeptidase [Schleiferiaceae bacterium]
MFGIIILFVIIGFIVQQRLKSKFKKYSKEALSNGMSGAEIAQKMLEDHFIYDVRIESVAGKLTDHYNPANKTVNLSPEVYSGRSVAAAAVAAHEVGHAVQHAKGYKWLEMRSQLVPMVQFSGKIMNIVIWSMILGVGFLGIFGMNTAIWVLIAAQMAITAFTLVTLPVEYDASNRALAWLTDKGMINAQEHEKANDALSWAARTYLVAALASMAQLAYYFSLLRD